MKYRKLSTTGDYQFGNNLLDFHKDSAEGVAQKVKTRLLLWMGEWFLDTEEGTMWVQGVIGKQQQSTIDEVLRSRILDTEGVTEIISYTSTIDADSRKLFVSVLISTIYGEANLIGVGI